MFINPYYFKYVVIECAQALPLIHCFIVYVNQKKVFIDKYLN